MLGFDSIKSASKEGINYSKAIPGNGEAINVSSQDYTTNVNGGMILYIGTGGDIKIDMADSGTGLIFTNIPNGSFFPARVSKVYSTGTSATDIVGVY